MVGDEFKYLGPLRDVLCERGMGIIDKSLEVKLPTIWTVGKADVGRVREEKRTRKKIREEKVRRKKRQVREKVGK